MFRYLLAVSAFLLMLLCAGHALALEVVAAGITTAVVDREPVDEVEVFPSQNGKLYCFTRVTGANEATFVYHLWFRGGQLMSRVELPVNSPDWRTWSAKQFVGDDPGEWRVKIQDATGMVMRQIAFQLR